MCFPTVDGNMDAGTADFGLGGTYPIIPTPVNHGAITPNLFDGGGGSAAAAPAGTVAATDDDMQKCYG